jgi:hypothetical protein
MGLKLHIGCGSDIKPGYINIDQFNPHADIKMPIQELNYGANTIERIEGYMVIQYLLRREALDFVRNVYRMLEPNGSLILECQDATKVARLILLFANDPEYLEKGPFGLRGFFGEPTDHVMDGDYVKWGYTPSSATELMKEAGFSKIKITDGVSHSCPIRDMRIEAIK